MRSFMMLLLLIIVFLIGMLFGVEKSGYTIDSELNGEITEEETVEEESFPVESTDDKDEKQTQTKDETTRTSDPLNNDKENVTQKTAGFLEKGVKTFYNLIIEVMYQLSNAFF